MSPSWAPLGTPDGLRNALAPLAGLPVAGRVAPTEISVLVDLLPAFLDEDAGDIDQRLRVVLERWDRAARPRCRRGRGYSEPADRLPSIVRGSHSKSRH